MRRGLKGHLLSRKKVSQLHSLGVIFLLEPKMGREKQLPSAFLPWKKINQGHNAIQVVILVQTRELALQTSQVCKELGKHLQIQVMATTGGTSLKDDIMWLYQPVHLLVGTPGRVLDLAKKGVCISKDCSMLIMDEADKLLSLEFQPLVEQLIHFLPKDHQILMFSATFPVTLKEFKDSVTDSMTSKFSPVLCGEFDEHGCNSKVVAL